MKNQDESNKKLVELLWIEINRAIISSADVKAILSSLKELNLLKDVKEYNLVLDIDKLIKLSSVESEDNSFSKKLNNIIVDSYSEDFGFNDSPGLVELKDKGASSQEPVASKEYQNNRQYIDGKPMTQNQILFQEYQEQLFDNEAWLKKARIYF